VTCSAIKGSIKFNPPLTAAGASTSETATSKTTVSSCVTTGGGKTPTKGTSVITTVYSTNGCVADLEGKAKAQVITTKWAPGSIAPSVVSFPPATGTTTPTITLSYGGAGTSAIGSCIGTDGGASSSVTVDIAGSVTSITASCMSAKGLKSLTITGGIAVGK